MEVPRIIQWHSSWASPYATELYIVGDESLLNTLESREGSGIVRNVAINVASDGNKSYWQVAQGGEWVFVRVPGHLRLESYPVGRQPVDGMKYLPVKPGERFEGQFVAGKNRTRSIYAVVLSKEGVSLTPTERESWGDRAYDITGSERMVQPAVVAEEEVIIESTPEQSGTRFDELPLAAALRKAGLA